MLSPNIHRNHMFPMTWSHEPCRNMQVKRGSRALTGSKCEVPLTRAVTWLGTTPNWKIRALRSALLCRPTDHSKRKIAVLRAIRKYVTYGVLNRGVSSRRGIIED